MNTREAFEKARKSVMASGADDTRKAVAVAFLNAAEEKVNDVLNEFPAYVKITTAGDGIDVNYSAVAAVEDRRLILECVEYGKVYVTGAWEPEERDGVIYIPRADATAAEAIDRAFRAAGFKVWREKEDEAKEPAGEPDLSVDDVLADYFGGAR